MVVRYRVDGRRCKRGKKRSAVMVMMVLVGWLLVLCGAWLYLGKKAVEVKRLKKEAPFV